MGKLYDDNFGAHDIRSRADVERFRRIQRSSVDKVCEGCGRGVRLKAAYRICHRCAVDRDRRRGD